MSAALQGVMQQASREAKSIRLAAPPLVIIFAPFPARVHRGKVHVVNIRQEVMMKTPKKHKQKKKTIQKP